MRSRFANIVAGAFIAGCATSAVADNEPKVDKNVCSIFNPTPDKYMREFSPDRPTKNTNPFTIDAGHLDIESDFVSYLHSDVHGVNDRSFQFLDPTIKLGVLNNVDVEMTMNGDEFVRKVQDATPSKGHDLRGLGDTFFRSKINLFGNDDGKVALAFVPFVKLPANSPASRELGDGVVEGGGFFTMQAKLPADFQIGLQSEVDALEGGMDSRRHANYVNIAVLVHEVPMIKDLYAYSEFYSSVSTDRYTPSFYTADFALGYLVRPSTKFDIGANIGLNRDAPNLQLYAGVSQRF